MGFEGEIVVLGNEGHPAYNRTFLSKEAFARGQGIGEVTLRQNLTPGSVEWRLDSPAASANISKRTVTLATGEVVDWAGLVVATGLRSRRLPLATPGDGVHALRSFKDATALRRELRPHARLLIIGAGFIGCEIASVARAQGCTVTLVANEAGPMIGPLGPEISLSLKRRHDQQGVRSFFLTEISEIAGSPRPEAAVLANGESIAVDIVLEAVGSLPNTTWLDGNGLDLTDGILCDNALRVIGVPYVVAVGDIARFPNTLFDDVPRRLEHWCMPTYTARRAARSLLADLGYCQDDTGPFQPLPSFWTDQGDFRLNSFGMPHLGIDDSRLLEGDLASEFICGYFVDNRLIGIVGIGLQSRFPHYMNELGKKRSATRRRDLQQASQPAERS
jgi:3-phenylpropionate/trans-cinnamate dioxygenase ferredoxin reductase subunit